ncbi:protein RESTRICTED TEV MOVEMENT 2-like [Gossypium arboreum]|uniref:SHSP domain-containing protein n=1 Tax=Gossypium arboreum TaxID=29729 RepID=A0ABR0PTW0_GOSAR|nr:protein RESTRICTED TEV MOVEMENT 2-like [Gossypium arboreum]KAK5830443.1 hypothetical protein PVK06_014237 [Gossypium arboreum]
MALNPQPAYENLEVYTEWVHETAEDTLIAYLHGFRKEQLKVQLTSGGNLRISGEKPIGDNIFSRFSKEFSIPSNCDLNNIRANYRGSMLQVKFPKQIVPADEKPEKVKAVAEVPNPKPDHKPADVPEKQNNAVQEGHPKTTLEKQTGDDSNTDGVAKEAGKVSEKTPDKQEEMEDQRHASNGADHRLMEKSSSASEKPVDSALRAAQRGIVYKQVVEGLAKGVKDPRKVMNMVLAVLLVVVLAVYLRNAIMSLGNY